MNIKLAKIQNKIYKKDNYLKTNYTGLAKILYYFNHKLLEFGYIHKYNEHIVEVGGGAEPHINYMDVKNIKSYTIVDSIKYKKKINNLKKKYKKTKFYFIDYRKKLKKRKYTRLISSHTFEHFNNFEKNFINLLNCLKKDSIISIALPCDPGMFWRVLQYLYYFKQKKYYGWKSIKEKDLSHSRDHCTPVQNIEKIINFYFKKKKKYYFPLFFPSINLNIFLIIQLKLNNFIN
tara:strand:- start:213 stop:911 length:699 start_codon:yes stop_codon:yes gene_type:complete